MPTAATDARPYLNGTLLARLSEPTRAALLALAPPRTFPSDTRLIRQGGSDTHVCVLGAGPAGRYACVKISATSRSGQETLLAIGGSGDVVGEMAALRGERRTADVTTCTVTVAHVVPQERFLGFLRRHEDAWRELSAMLADQLAWSNRRRLDFLGYDIAVRLARVLLELVERHGQRAAHGYEPGVLLTQSELGSLVGARPDSVGLAVRKLRAQGLVESRYRGVVVTDLDGLRTFADEA